MSKGEHLDARLRYLKKKLDNCKIVDPKDQQNLDRIFFGAKVTYAKEDDSEVTVHLVGVDEADVSAGKINWQSPVGKALMKAQEGDVVKVRNENGLEEIEIVEIIYPLD